MSGEPQLYNARKRQEYARRVEAMTPEEREAHLSGLRAKTSRWHAGMTLEEREAYLEKERFRHQVRKLRPGYMEGMKERSRKNGAKRYGLTLEAYDALVAKPCAVCGEEDRPRVVDHCHTSGIVRGTLCHACNTSIGRMKEDADNIRALAAYVDTWSVLK